MQGVNQEPIAIVGIGCRFPQAQNPQEFWHFLREGKDAIREVPAERWNANRLYDPNVAAPGKTMSRWGSFLDQIDQFDWRAFRMLPREVTYMDPQHRLLLEVAWEALEDAGIPFQEVAGSRTSVSIGIGWSDYMRLQTRNWSQLSEYTATGNANGFAANRLSYFFDLKGPSVSVDSGCTSSLTAIYLACQSLWTGEADLALAGGVSLILSPDSMIMVSKSGLLSPQGHCKTLDAEADGFVRGEGSGIIVLKPLSQVKKSDRVYSLIRGIAVNHNGHNEWIIAASQIAQEALLQEAYHKAGVKPSEVSYVELHGTGFQRGDILETQALGTVLGAQPERTHPCLIGSVKTNIGHLEAASGIASIIKVALSLYHQEIPPTLNLETLNPAISLDELHLAVPQTNMPWPEEEEEAIAGVTTLALTGANAHVVLSARASIGYAAYPESGANDKQIYRLLPLSARGEQALYKQAEAYRDFLLTQSSNNSSVWRDICYSASVRRTHHSHRLAVVGRTAREAADTLRLYLQKQNSSDKASINSSKKQHKLLFLFAHDSTAYSQIDWVSFQSVPAFHKVLQECDSVFQQLTGHALLPNDGGKKPFALHAHVSPQVKHFVLQVALTALWQEWGVIPTTVLGEGLGEVTAAYVTGALSLKDALWIILSQPENMAQTLKEIRLLPTNTPLYSASVGLMNQGPDLSIAHWYEQLANSKLSTSVFDALLSGHYDAFVEIGYPSALLGAVLARLQDRGETCVLLASLQREKDVPLALLEALKTLYTLGHTINWSQLYQMEACQCVSLPLYPWQRERLWPDWLDVEEVSTPPEEGHTHAQKAQQAEELTSIGRPVEQVLQELWAKVLGLETVSASDSFFELGGHSLLAMQLLARIQDVFQVEIALNDLLEAPTPSACAEIVLQKCASLTNSEGMISLLPSIEPDQEHRYEPFLTTDVQQAYWVGRHAAFNIGNVGNHGYIEVEATDLDLARFSRALQRLIERHDMLRAVLLPDGRQQVLEQVPPFEIRVMDLSGLDPQVQTDQLEQVRQTLDHQLLPVGQWPAFELWVSRLDEHCVRLHLSIESIFVDAWSMNRLIHAFIRLYHEPDHSEPLPTLSFRDYVLAEASLHSSALYQRSRQYWLERLSSLPPSPDLPLASETEITERPRFVHRESGLAREHWQQLKAYAARIGVTPSGVLLTAFAHIIAAWSQTPHFSLNLSTFNRLPLHPQVNEIVGDFTSLLVLAVDYTTPTSFEERARSIQGQLWKDLDHSSYSGIQVLRELVKLQGEGIKAIMPIVFTSLLIQDAASPLPPPWGKTLYCVSQTPQVWLDHQVLESGGELVFHWQSVDAIFPVGLIDAMFAAYCQLLQRLATGAGWAQDTGTSVIWSETIWELLPEQQRTLLAQVNATETSFEDYKEEAGPLLHALFHKQVMQRPEQLALITQNRLLTYKQVNSGALQLAHQLRDWGVRPNQLVGIVMEKGWEQAVAVLGILQSGAAYLPIDANLPRERLWYLLEDGQVQVVLTQSWIDRQTQWPRNLKRISVDSLDLDEENIPELASVQGPDDLAYVIYTSGSTGRPKGVMIEHHGAVNTILDINRRFNIGSGDRVLALSALNFDLSVYDIFGPLAAGGTIVMPDGKALRDPASWLKIIKQEQITIWNTVPALLQVLVEYTEAHREAPGAKYSQLPGSLRLALLSGDWIPLTLPERAKKLCPGMEVISLGGATEASIWSILYPITALNPAWKSIPYGRPMANQQFFVLNKELELCPIWVSGDLYIAGVGLARGYWGDQEKTRSSFFEHPRMGIRLYRTGDRGRYLPDGTIEFLGRKDFQVKIQGHRIELGEIEATLARHPDIQEAVVIALGEKQGEKRLAAYMVKELDHSLTASDVRHFLAECLPSYMVPTTFHFLDALPLTTNGKVDRKALAAERELHTTPTSDASPLPLSEQNQVRATVEEHKLQSTLVVQITDLVKSILNIERIDPARNLLEYGATSMDIFRIANLLESQLHIHLEFSQLFRLSSIDAIAEYWEQHRTIDETRMSHVTGILAPMEKNGTGHVSATHKILLDPVEREHFKESQPGLRRIDNATPAVQLVMPELEGKTLRKYVERRSHRTFLQKPIPFKQFSEFIGCLQQISLEEKPKHQWGSAGSLYPVQAYVYVKPGRIEGVDHGIYYYHPVMHRLASIIPHVEIEKEIFGFVNEDLFASAAFAIFLIGQMKAIEPLYADLGRDFCLIEAGEIVQLLEMSAPSHQIALCQTGGIGFKKIEHLFALDDGSVYLHSLLGGALDPTLTDKHIATLEEKEEEWEEIAL